MNLRCKNKEKETLDAEISSPGSVRMHFCRIVLVCRRSRISTRDIRARGRAFSLSLYLSGIAFPSWIFHILDSIFIARAWKLYPYTVYRGTLHSAVFIIEMCYAVLRTYTHTHIAYSIGQHRIKFASEDACKLHDVYLSLIRP